MSQKKHPRCAYSGQEAPQENMPWPKAKAGSRQKQGRPRTPPKVPPGHLESPQGTPQAPKEPLKEPPGTPAGSTCCQAGNMCFPPKPRAQKGIPWGCRRQPHENPRGPQFARHGLCPAKKKRPGSGQSGKLGQLCINQLQKDARSLNFLLRYHLVNGVSPHLSWASSTAIEAPFHRRPTLIAYQSFQRIVLRQTLDVFVQRLLPVL